MNTQLSIYTSMFKSVKHKMVIIWWINQLKDGKITSFVNNEVHSKHKA